ncbi:DUF993 family protein [Arthrobacter sp. QXT-31]|uniref:DUF993 family protein n=1 Tax=Arthrobacter sp. QXT-31 TaxID=1357915 RepID=UPI001C129C4A|nr:DUF993 family protein [Arthrobacter sp. QXT-31]
MTITPLNTTIRIPNADGSLVTHSMQEPAVFERHPAPFTSRSVYAAAHVVADVRAEYQPGILAPIDWEATIAFRKHLFSYGIGIAEGMDTSERGAGGLDWAQAKDLIRYGNDAAREAGGAIVSGAGTDQLTSIAPSLDEIIDAYLEQVEFVESCGSAAVLRASHALVGAARSEDDYLEVYRRVLAKATKPVIVHWLGTVFDPSLRGYWGHDDPREAMRVVLTMLAEDPGKVRGVKFSLLDAAFEEEFRSLVPADVEVFTGDDYGYTDLLLGNGKTHSHGLLGVLDPIGPIASQAFAALDKGDENRFREVMNSTIPFAVKMFEPPADRYKTGTVFIAWLSGHQNHFRQVTGREGCRSLQHLTDLFVGADQLGLFPDPDLAAHRMRLLLATAGIE